MLWKRCGRLEKVDDAYNWDIIDFAHFYHYSNPEPYICQHRDK
jgi:hypothetical protein